MTDLRDLHTRTRLPRGVHMALGESRSRERALENRTPAGGSGDGITFDTYPQSGDWLVVQTTGATADASPAIAGGQAYGIALTSSPGAAGSGMLLSVAQTGTDAADALDVDLVTEDGNGLGMLIYNEATGDGETFGILVQTQSDGDGDSDGIEADVTAEGDGDASGLYTSVEADGVGTATGVTGDAAATATGGVAIGGYFVAFSEDGGASSKTLQCVDSTTPGVSILEVWDDGTIHGRTSVGAIAWDLPG